MDLLVRPIDFPPGVAPPPREGHALGPRLFTGACISAGIPPTGLAVRDWFFFHPSSTAF